MNLKPEEKRKLNANAKQDAEKQNAEKQNAEKPNAEKPNIEPKKQRNAKSELFFYINRQIYYYNHIYF